MAVHPVDHVPRLPRRQQGYECTPWGNPTRTVFGWQKPCYLLGEGYAKSFRELMDDTEWDEYGVGNYEKCANCMVHCGFEATAVNDTVRHPLKALTVAMRGVRTDGPMAPDISLEPAAAPSTSSQSTSSGSCRDSGHARPAPSEAKCVAAE